MGDRPNMRDIAGEDHKPKPRGNPGVVKEQTRKENEMENFIGKLNITGSIY